MTVGALLAEGEQHAFRGTPGSAVGPLTALLATAPAGSSEADAAHWLLGVAHGARGAFADALDVLRPLVDLDTPATQPPPARRLLTGLAAATAASVHRQVGDVAAARALDDYGLAAVAALGAAAAEAVADCELGLAGDAVAVGDLPGARQHVGAAAAVITARADPGWRTPVRLDWARADVALLDGDARTAAADAANAVARAERARAPRHVAKGLLLRGTALLSAGELSAAVPVLRRSAVLSESLGCLPLVWRARGLLAAVAAGTPGGEREAADDLAAARAATSRIAAGLPPGWADRWLRRDDVAALQG